MVLSLNTAFKNLGRAKIRALVTITASVFGIMGYIFFSSLSEGVSKDTEKVHKEFITGESQLRLISFYEDRKRIGFENLFNYSSLHSQLDAFKSSGISIESKIIVSGELIFYASNDFALDGSLKVSLVGSSNEIKGLKAGISASEANAQGQAGIWVSEYLADKLQAKVGSSIIVSAKTSGGSYEAIDAEILGLFTTNSLAVNMSNVFVSSSILEDYLFVDINNEATEILLSSKKPLDLSSIPDIKQYDWEDLSENLLFMKKFEDQRMIFFNLFMTIIVCVGVVNTMLMNVYERLREIGIMRAYGIYDRELIFMFMNEGLALGIISSVVGVILGLLVIVPLILYGIDLTSMVGDIKTSGPTILKGIWPWFAVIKVVIYNICICVIFSAVAAWTAVKKTVLESINA